MIFLFGGCVFESLDGASPFICALGTLIGLLFLFPVRKIDGSAFRFLIASETARGRGDDDDEIDVGGL